EQFSSLPSAMMTGRPTIKTQPAELPEWFLNHGLPLMDDEPYTPIHPRSDTLENCAEYRLPYSSSYNRPDVKIQFTYLGQTIIHEEYLKDFVKDEFTTSMLIPLYHSHV
ncbi:hypothetical protein PENTCL1PPCAC_13834, partial [Pristionchus entomophagus]